ncbi:hypothetical protein D3C84_697320 [compost metagenome]
MKIYKKHTNSHNHADRSHVPTRTTPNTKTAIQKTRSEQQRQWHERILSYEIPARAEFLLGQEKTGRMLFPLQQIHTSAEKQT